MIYRKPARLILMLIALFATTASAADKPKSATLSKQATAIFAMGCFWCAEADFEKARGVIRVVSGYTGGTCQKPDL